MQRTGNRMAVHASPVLHRGPRIFRHRAHNEVGCRNWRFRIDFVMQDLWVGVYWKQERTLAGDLLTTWFVCGVPCFPFVVQHVRRPINEGVG